MTTWHNTRRVIAGIVAGIVAAGAQRYGVPLPMAVACGIAAAVIVASLIIPLVWKPPADLGLPPQNPSDRAK
jgi:hypothetical protein